MDQTPIVLEPPIILAHEQPFRIGPVEVRPATREIVNDGSAGIVEPRVMQMLVVLHRADGGVVSKDDLIRFCWDGRVVGEDAINRVVSRLRHDAAEKAGGAFRIETITKVGYRLVEEGVAATAVQPMDRRRLIIGGTAAVTAASAAIVGWGVLKDPRLDGEAATLVEESRSAMQTATPEQVSNAIAKLKRASQLEPENAEVWGLLALGYRWQIQQAPADQRAVVRSRAVAAESRALAIDPSNGDALTSQVLAIPFFGNWLAFEAAARRVFQRWPNHPVMNGIFGNFLGHVGRNSASLPYLDTSLRVEPMAVHPLMFKASALWNVGRLDEAESTIEQAFRLWPRHYGIWFTRLYFLANNGRAQEALAMLADRDTRPIGIPNWNFDLTELQVRALATKDPAVVNEAMQAWLDLARRGVGFAENAIVFAGSIGKIDEAFTILDALFFDRGFTMSERRWSTEQGLYSDRRDRNTHFLFHSLLAGVRRDPRFAKLTNEIGLVDYWRQSGSRPDYFG